jgi:EmrB/QacA subfamily drug resistance transporter
MDSHTLHDKRRWAILGILGVGQLMVVLDSTVINVALPSAQRALHFSDHDRQWIITAYMLAFGSVLLLGGKLSDLFGRKRTLIAGLSGFAVASAIGGAAQSFTMLAAARALQGVFAALLAPAALALLTTTFSDPRERGRAFGVFGAIASCGASIGLVLGGLLTQMIEWRAAMYVNLIFAAIAVGGALVLLRNEVPEQRPKLDIRGALAASAGLFALVFGFSHAEMTGWGNPVTIGALVLALALLALFVVIQARVEHPLLPLRVLADRGRGGAYLAIALAMIGMFGVFLFLTYYLQQNLHYSPVRAGLAFLPMSLGVMLASATAQTRLLPRYGPRPLVALGMGLGAAAMLLLARLTVHSDYVSAICAPLLVLGAGVGLVIATSINTGTLGVTPRDAGVASAAVSTCQQIGCAIGTALLSTLAASATYSSLHGHRRTRALLADATVHGYTTAFWCSAGIFAVGAILAAVMFPRGHASGAHAAQPAFAH